METKQKIELVIRKEEAETVRFHRVRLFHLEDAEEICQFLTAKAKYGVTCRIELTYIYE